MTQSGYVRDPEKYPDKTPDWLHLYTRRRLIELVELLDSHPEIIEEHAANPLGYRNHPSPYLQRLHNYFRMQPTFGKYYIYSEEWGTYRIAEVGEWGQAPTLDDEVLDSEEAAMHAVFLKRIADLRHDAKAAN